MTVELLRNDPELDELIRRSQRVMRTMIFLLISAGAVTFVWFAREWLWHFTVLLLLTSSTLVLMVIATVSVVDALRDH